MNSKLATDFRNRRGAVSVITAIVLIVMIAFVALAIDIGYVALTKTSMQAAADSAALSGGTELKSSLGPTPVAAATMRAAANALAVDYAARHANGDVSATYLDSASDVRFGWAKFNTGTGAWDTHWGDELPDVGGHNLIGVLVHRDRANSNLNDQPLPLIFASVIGSDQSTLLTAASAVIMPAKGIRIIPGSDETADVMPFTIRKGLWEKYLRAQTYYEEHPDMFVTPPTDAEYEANVDSVTGEPLFGHMIEDNQGVLEFRQDFADDFDCGCNSNDSTSVVGPASDAYSDGVLEINVYPKDDYTSGNFGSIDLGSSDNSTQDLSRQIVHGVNESDLSIFPENKIVIPTSLEGDTGVSAGIKDELESIIGDCRAIFLFETVQDPGNNAVFEITAMAGIRIMDVELTGSLEYKSLTVQRCNATLSGAIGDIDEQIVEGTTVFTPLILIE